ncbi:hypothetical protein [Xanthomonas oryzae]|uniref:hypothetical protein n=1 Tax=Xanthomonas oryzae TaxID=347 RepID=UPI002DF5EB8E|nr:hypothetical protein [Xanthomonas oryzae pv. oryzicola]MEC5115302.1 hypothetical protein [Xanthomonas oryzae pv. oryzicola]
MSMTQKREISDRDIQLFFDSAGKLLEAAESDGAKARKAIDALTSFQSQVGARLSQLEVKVVQKIEAAAERTADKAAKLLQERFHEADAAAEKAAERYRQAAARLTFRLWTYSIAPPAVVLLVLAVLAFAMIPSLDDINQRRAELSSLDSQIQGKRLRWTTCMQDSKPVPCFEAVQGQEVNCFNATDGSRLCALLRVRR